MTRTVAVRAVLENAQQILKPNLYMDVTITTKKLPPSIVVPSSAVIRLKNLNYVIIQNADGRFAAQEVVLGAEAQGYIQITLGSRRSDRVVTSALFLIDSEANV